MAPRGLVENAHRSRRRGAMPSQPQPPLDKKKNWSYLNSMKAKSKKKNRSKKKPARASRQPPQPPMKEPDGQGSADMQSILSEIHGANDGHKRLEHWEQVECPYCGEGFEVHIDSAEDGQTLYEDCHVCCKPISIHVQVEEEDVHISVARS